MTASQKTLDQVNQINIMAVVAEAQIGRKPAKILYDIMRGSREIFENFYSLTIIDTLAFTPDD